MLCPRCGRANAPQAAFCVACAQALLPNTQAPPAGMAYPPPINRPPTAVARPVENTSGMNKGVPPELKRAWNWGAAFLPLFWAMAHRVWVYYACLAIQFAVGILAVNYLRHSYGPDSMTSWLYIGLFCLLSIILFFYLGLQGNALAWKHRRFQDVRHCERVQSSWNSWGIVFFSMTMAIFLFGLYGWSRFIQFLKPTPPPTAYIGAWRNVEGATSRKIAISVEGQGFRSIRKVSNSENEMRSGSGYVKINEQAHLLEMSGVFFHIDAAPHLVNGTMEMTLDGVTYKRTGDYQSVFKAD